MKRRRASAAVRTVRCSSRRRRGGRRAGLQLGLGGAAVGELLAEVHLVGRGEEWERADLVEVLAQQRAAGTTASLGSIGHERGR